MNKKSIGKYSVKIRQQENLLLQSSNKQLCHNILPEMEFQITLFPVMITLVVVVSLLLLMVFKVLNSCCCDPPCCCSTAKRCSGHCPLGLGREGEDCPAYCPYVWMDCCPCRNKDACKEEVEENKQMKKEE